MKCYWDGEAYDVGTNPTSIIANTIAPLEHLVLGGLTSLGAFSYFDGYVKELRVWNVARSAFELDHFRDEYINSADPRLIAYYKLDESDTDAAYQDYGPDSLSLAFDGSWTMSDQIDLNPVVIHFCAEGMYSSYNYAYYYYECLPCDSSCKSCKGPTADDCTACSDPATLIEADFACKVLGSCPDG